jgi:DNA invertase Pin-like site-specific DNA recombinase
MKKYFAYIRVSTGLQEKRGSQRTQRNEIEEYAKRNDLNIVKYYEDLDISGSISERENFNKMLKYIDNVDGIIIQDWSRISRDKYFSGHVLWVFQTNDIEIHSVLKNKVLDYDNPADFLEHMVKAYTDDLQRIETKKKQKAGIKRFIKENGYWGRKKRVFSKKEIEQYKAYRTAGISKLGISRLFKMSPRVLYRNIRELGLEELKTLKVNEKN